MRTGYILHGLVLSHSLLVTVALGTPLPAQVSVLPATVKSLEPAVVGWPGYGRDPSHNAQSPVASQNLQRIRWSTPVDQQPQYSGSSLLIHYGSPLVTQNGTIVVTVKVGVSGTFQVEGRRPANGALLWTLPTDYLLAPHNWTPSCGPTLTPANELAVPAAGGTILMRRSPDSATGLVRRLAFYGLANYTANPAAYNNNVIITTPITADGNGNLYFGFLVTGATPINLQSGIARISAAGVGSWVAASTAANDAAIRKVVYNCAPALSVDGSALYVAVNDIAASGFGRGFLLRLDSQTLAMTNRIRLRDVVNPTRDALLPDDGTASPAVGPDGDVYFGVLESPFPSNNDRGWMLHFNGLLTQTKIPGAFGWDDTISVVPSAAVPSYSGTSAYLVLTKYNNYGGIGSGNGLNKVGVLDPNASMTDPITGGTVMREVLTVLGPTPDPAWAGGVREWCINSAAVDPTRRCALINSEDGKLYRWDFVTNTLAQAITLTPGIGEAYTPTIIGLDGTVYAINNATLFAVGN